MEKQTWVIQGSKNQKIFLRRYKNKSEEQVKGIVHILHGMAEYGARYGHFAQFLVEHGYTVYVHDHRKHGKSLQRNERVGIFTNDTWEDMIEDIHHVQKFIKSNEPETAHIMLGHSMGSVLLRYYLTVYGEEVDRAIIMGTVHSHLLENKAGAILSAACEAVAPSIRNKALDYLFVGRMNKTFEPAATEFDWLSRDKKVVDWYINSPLCGYQYSPRFYKEFAKGLDYVSNEENIIKTPHIPIALISGDMDPVGQFMEGVTSVYNMYKRLGYDVDLKSVANARHEILNEINKEEIYELVLNLIEGKQDEKR